MIVKMININFRQPTKIFNLLNSLPVLLNFYIRLIQIHSIFVQLKYKKNYILFCIINIFILIFLKYKLKLNAYFYKSYTIFKINKSIFKFLKCKLNFYSSLTIILKTKFVTFKMKFTVLLNMECLKVFPYKTSNLSFYTKGILHLVIPLAFVLYFLILPINFNIALNNFYIKSLNFYIAHIIAYDISLKINSISYYKNHKQINITAIEKYIKILFLTIQNATYKIKIEPLLDIGYLEIFSHETSNSLHTNILCIINGFEVETIQSVAYRMKSTSFHYRGYLEISLHEILYLLFHRILIYLFSYQLWNHYFDIKYIFILKNCRYNTTKFAWHRYKTTKFAWHKVLKYSLKIYTGIKCPYFPLFYTIYIPFKIYDQYIVKHNLNIQ